MPSQALAPLFRPADDARGARDSIPAVGRRRVAARPLQNRRGAQPIHHRVATKLRLAQVEQPEQGASGERLRQRLYRRAVMRHAGRSGLFVGEDRTELFVGEEGVWLCSGVEHRHAMQWRAGGQPLHDDAKRRPHLLFGVRDGDDAGGGGRFDLRRLFGSAASAFELCDVPPCRLVGPGVAGEADEGGQAALPRQRFD